MTLKHKVNFCTKMCTLSPEKLEFEDLFTFLSAPAVLHACLSSGLNLEESAAKAWMNWRLYSIFTTQVKCSAKRDILKHFSIHRTTFIRRRNLFHRNARGQQLCAITDAQSLNEYCVVRQVKNVAWRIFDVKIKATKGAICFPFQPRDLNIFNVLFTVTSVRRHN